MALVTTTLVVEFDRQEGSSLIVELDGREDGLNRGKTRFSPGDLVYFLLYKTKDIHSIENYSSAGLITRAGTGVRTVETFLQFLNADSATLQYPASRLLDTRWVGNNFGAVSIHNELEVKINKDSSQLPNPTLGVLKVSYETAFTIYRLSDTFIEGLTSYEILCYFTGKSGL